MDEESHSGEQQPRYGSRFARMFGFVTPEDRAGWEQQRAGNKPRVNAIRQGLKASMGALLEFADKNVHARLDAAHRVAAQKQFDESHGKIVTRQRDPRTSSIIETVGYETVDDRDSIEPDLEV